MDILNICAEAFILFPVLMVLAVNVSSVEFARKNFYVFAGVSSLLQMAFAATALVLMRLRDISEYNFSVLWDIRGDAAFFQITPVRLFLMFIVGLVALTSSMIARRTIDFYRRSYMSLLMMIVVGMNGIIVATDLFTLFVFMEVTGITSFVLIGMFKSRVQLEGSFKYLMLSELASIFILSGLAFLLMRTGSLTYASLKSTVLSGGNDINHGLLYFALVLIISGFSVKAGAVPFHSWLPDAHQSADTAVSVLLSGVVIKIAGIYPLLVVSTLFPEEPAIRAAFAFIGILSVILGALLAFRQKHFKRIIAYSSVSQMGYILLALSAGTTLGYVAAIAHIFSHAVFKSTLFVNAAAIHEQADTLEIEEMGGLEKVMPTTAFTSVIAFLSTAGIPPMAGFWSKLLVILSLWGAGMHALAAVALCSSILTGAYFLRMQKKVFFGKTSENMAEVKEVSGSIKIAEIMLTAITIAVGLAYPLILLYLKTSGVL